MVALRLRVSQAVWDISSPPIGAILVSGGTIGGSAKGYVYRVTPAGVIDARSVTAAYAVPGAVHQYVFPRSARFPMDRRSRPASRIEASSVMKLNSERPSRRRGSGWAASLTSRSGLGYSAILARAAKNGKILAGLRLRTKRGTFQFAVAASES
jgi:hypothetical protein